MRYIPYASHYSACTMFYGGQSADEAIGTGASFSYSRALDHRRNPSQLTVLPGPRQIGQGVVTDLILNIVQRGTGDRYAIGDSGNIYSILPDNTVLLTAKLPTGSDGLLNRTDDDMLFFATQTDFGRRYTLPDGSRTNQLYGPSKSLDPGAGRSGGTASYAVPQLTSGLVEADKCYFTSDIEPFYSIKVKIVSKPTANLNNLILTLHNGDNKSLASVSILPAAVNAGDMLEFVFPSPVRALVKPNARTYHFHLSSGTGGGGWSVAAASANDPNTLDFEVWASRLIQQKNGFHPMAQFLQYVCIGNANHLAVYEPLDPANPSNTDLDRHRLTFPEGYEVCGVAPTDEFLAIAAAKYSTSNAKDFQEGKLFLWDGISKTYNQIIDISGGAPEGMYTHENYPYFFANGTLCAYTGGKNITKVRTLANTDTTYTKTVDATRVYPNMMTVRDGILHCGYPSTSNNASIERGVYAWGALEKNYPASFNYAYVPSSMQTTPTGADLHIGCVRNFGDEMYISWKDKDGNYGLDVVDSFCDPAPIFKFRARRFDGGSPYRDKTATKIALATAPLPTGVSLKVVTKTDSDSLTDGQTMPAGGEKLISPVPDPKNFKRIVYGFDGTVAPGSATPTIYAAVMEYKPLIEQMSL